MSNGPQWRDGPPLILNGDKSLSNRIRHVSRFGYDSILTRLHGWTLRGSFYCFLQLCIFSSSSLFSAGKEKNFNEAKPNEWAADPTMNNGLALV